MERKDTMTENKKERRKSGKQRRFISCLTREIRTCHFPLHRVYRGAGNIVGFLTIHCDMSRIYMERKNGRAIQTI
jgi:hypothetical protein